MRVSWILLAIAPVFGFGRDTQDFLNSAQELTFFLEEERVSTAVSYSDLELDDGENDPYPLLEIFDDEEEFDDLDTSQASKNTIKETEALYKKIEKDASEEPLPSYEERGSLFTKPKITQLPPEPVQEKSASVSPQKEIKVIEQPAKVENKEEGFSRKGKRKAPIAHVSKNPASKSKQPKKSQIAKKKQPLKSQKKVCARPKAIAKQSKSGQIKKRALRAAK